ncbi:hypothetical protein M413DRAFT_26868 [Hebeloma cylindrosporum]|uniref:Uncharacterized protein n=1 Tax=Hebeloma cylindrosporum TaxID=76867 RepID=A0A0C2XZ28_HEBCY|nr:hypothetical protein M413DRAFT_26868 [Hebeloma cylindrosporum h7]
MFLALQISIEDQFRTIYREAVQFPSLTSSRIAVGRIIRYLDILLIVSGHDFWECEPDYIKKQGPEDRLRKGPFVVFESQIFELDFLQDEYQIISRNNVPKTACEKVRSLFLNLKYLSLTSSRTNATISGNANRIISGNDVLETLLKKLIYAPPNISGSGTFSEGFGLFLLQV